MTAQPVERKRTRTIHDELRDGYAAGRSLATIATLAGVATTTAREYGRRLGLHWRMTGPAPHTYSFVDLGACGLHAGVIASYLGVSRERVIVWAERSPDCAACPVKYRRRLLTLCRWVDVASDEDLRRAVRQESRAIDSNGRRSDSAARIAQAVEACVRERLGGAW